MNDNENNIDLQEIDPEIYIDKADKKSQDKVKEAIQIIISEMNIMGNENLVRDAIKEELSKTHRTLQQGFFRNVIAPAIFQYAEFKKNKWFDLRNEDACNCAEKLEPILKDSYFRFI